MSALTIGQIAKKAEVGVETVRFYEKKGLIENPLRKESGYRQYSARTVQKIRFIKHAQKLGFSLSEIKDLLSLRSTPDAQCAEVRMRAEEKMRDIVEKIHILEAMRKALSRLVDQCQSQAPLSDCPILDAIEAEDVSETES